MKKYVLNQALLAKRFYRAKIFFMPRQTFQGLIRGTIVREQRIAPYLKTAVFRRRLRLISLYKKRFGIDAFIENIQMTRAIQPRKAWLDRGYPVWRERSTLNSTRTPSGADQ